jgi:hypothetical protein
MLHVWERGEAHMGFWWVKPKRNRPLMRRRVRWEDNTKVDLKEISREGVYRIDLAQDVDKLWVVVNVVMNHRASENVRDFLNS